MYKIITLWFISIFIHLTVAWYSFHIGYEVGKKKMYDKILLLTNQNKLLKEV